MRIRDFCFAYDTTPVLNHLDLSIEAGEAVALVGDNGSGKSTLLRALCGLVFAAQGSYEFDGAPVTQRSMNDAATSKRLHARVGMLFQNSSQQLFCASVEDEVAFGPRQMGLGEDEVRRRVDDACDLLRIGQLRGRAPWTLSGGEQRRVAIASVLSMNPDVYLFDEPLSGLDATSREWLVGFLGQLRDAGKTLVIATHDKGLVDAVASRVVRLGPATGGSTSPQD